MTKAEILKMIEGGAEAQKQAIEMVNKVLESVSVSDDTLVLASILHTMCGCFCDTMNNLSLILCKMLPEEETPETAPEKAPEKHPRGHHCSVCEQNDPGCKCLTCSRDNFDVNDGKPDCCRTHPHKGCCVDECPDYVKEDPDASV